MCNAHNHAPGCNCGWGGVWYGNTRDDDSWLFHRRFHRRLGTQKGTFEPISSGQTVPNSRCPVCGEPVFFYMSPFGGRVFFDELGPPWPKHPCTDLLTTGTRSPTRASASKNMDWLSCAEIFQVDPMQFVIRGRNSSQRKFQFYFTATELVMAEIVRFRPLGKGRVELSILDYNDQHRQWFSWDGLGFAHPTATAEQALTKTMLHSHDNSAQPLLSAGRATRAIEVPSRVATEFPSIGGLPSRPLYQCPYCPARLAERNVRRHLKKAHSADEASLSKFDKSKYSCPFCHERFSVKDMGKHLKLTHSVTDEQLLALSIAIVTRTI